MMNLKKALSVLACLLVLLQPLAAGAVTDTSYITIDSELPAYRSVFEAQLRVHADGFPQDGKAHYGDWQSLFERISLKGTVDTQRMLDPFSRVYMDAQLQLDNQPLIPFEYDGYYSYRYLRSPALGPTSLHFQMSNFFEFMLKSYYYMDLPTPWIALALYPEESVYWAKRYLSVFEEYIGDADEVSYDDLYEMCQELDDFIWGETEYRAYHYATVALVDMSENDRLLSQLGALEEILDRLDPEYGGMIVTRDGDSITYTIGETDVLTRTQTDTEECWQFEISDTEDYFYTAAFEKTQTDLTADVQMSLDGECIVGARLEVDGMQAFGDLGGRGQVKLTFRGSGLREPMAPIVFDWSISKSAAQLPYEVKCTLDWVHPLTERPAIGIAYQAQMTQEDATILIERPYDNQDDLFHMNDSVLAELKESVLPSLVSYSLPLAVSLPAGVISDVIAFMANTGFLAFIGIE